MLRTTQIPEQSEVKYIRLHFSFFPCKSDIGLETHKRLRVKVML